MKVIINYDDNVVEVFETDNPVQFLIDFLNSRKDITLNEVSIDHYAQRKAGKASASRLTPEQRTTRAKNAVLARIKKYNQRTK